MDVSVVVPTLNGREQLASCLDALREHAPGVETIVVNGPSTDGTSGMVRDRDDVSVLVELDERSINVARNAGLDRARGDVVAFLEQSVAVREGWLESLREGIATAAEEVGAVTGPVHEQLDVGVTPDAPESRTIRGRTVSYFDGANVAIERGALEAVDGFDEYLLTGGARDAAHRLAGREFVVEWCPGMAVGRLPPTGTVDARRAVRPDGGETERDWHWRYRSLAYRLVKNYGLRPSIAYRLVRHGATDAVGALREVASGDVRPSSWFGNGRDVLSGMATGALAGVRARFRDRSPRRNPSGWSARADRAVAVSDRR